MNTLVNGKYMQEEKIIKEIQLWDWFELIDEIPEDPELVGEKKLEEPLRKYIELYC